MKKTTCLSVVKSYSSLFLLCFMVYLLFLNLLPVTDPVESNYALTAKEMVLKSDWVSPQIYGKVWFDKPIFFYWLTAASFKVFGISAISARIPSAFFGAAGLMLIYWFIRKLKNGLAAKLSLVIMGTSLEYVILAKLIVTDMVFFVFNSAALVFFYLGYRDTLNGPNRWYWGMYISLALAVLTKGPVGIILPFCVVIVFLILKKDKVSLRKLFSPIGLLLLSLIALPWYVSMYHLHGNEFLKIFFGVHNYLRAVVSEHPKDNVSYYYIAVFFISMFPWSPLALKALAQNLKKVYSSEETPIFLFLFVWIAVYFIFYSFMATKYVTYIFPVVFPVSILTAFVLQDFTIAGKIWEIILWIGVPLGISLVGYLLLAAYYIPNLKFVLILSGLCLVTVWSCFWQQKQSTKRLVTTLFICQLMLMLSLSFFVFPEIAEQRSELNIAQFIRDNPEARFGFYQFYSTASVFYSGSVPVKIGTPENDRQTQSRETLSWTSKYTMPEQSLVEFIAQSPKKSVFVIVPETKKNQFNKEAQGLKLDLAGRTKHYNYYYINTNQ